MSECRASSGIDGHWLRSKVGQESGGRVMFQRSPRSSGKSGGTNISSPQTVFELYYKLGLVDIKVESSRLDALCAKSPSGSLRSESPSQGARRTNHQGYF